MTQAKVAFETLDPGLNKRVDPLAWRLGKKSGASIPRACGSLTELQRARSLRNEQVAWKRWGRFSTRPILLGLCRRGAEPLDVRWMC